MPRRSVLLTIVMGLSLMGASVAGATNYYFSTSSGDDSRSADQAQNPETPWRSVDKLNESMHLFGPGDSILFRRGEVFLGHIDMNSSGSRDANLTLGAYGSGAHPVIQGNISIGPWSQTGDRIWSADYAGDGSIHNFLINDVAQQLGRYPNPDAANRGYLRIDSHAGRKSVTSSSLLSGNWTGGEAVIRTVRWVLDRLPIESHEGSTIQLSEGTSFGMTNGYGFFIQNHLSTLDREGEWYFDKPAGKLYLYWNEDPNLLSTTVTAFENTLHAIHDEFVTIQDLEFSGSQKQNIFIDHCHHLRLRTTKFVNRDRMQSIYQALMISILVTTAYETQITTLLYWPTAGI